MAMKKEHVLNKEIHKFSDFAKDFVGPKVHINDVINKDITVLGFKKHPSKIAEYETKEYAMFQIEVDGSKSVLITSSKVLISQAETYISQIPFITRIKRHNGFYTFA